MKREILIYQRLLQQGWLNIVIIGGFGFIRTR